ncbi:MAG: TonB-dependent receptor plug domain-containing protein, partial [Candidatus Marinimicrobia bacterium]|nr:TonB-dependent receptor plug domain-containing protein [Candidatus Neomarinimicrobiota bacterium]
MVIKFQLLYLSIFTMSLVFSTEINSGYVFSNYGEPVPFASVVNIRTKSWSITDESGFYQLPLGTLPTDSLKISKIGFSSSFHLPQEQKHRKIVLSQEVIVLDPITIVGEKPITNRNLDKVTLLEMDGFSRANALDRIPGTLVRSAGGLPGITTVSMDGGQAVHTKITLDGIDLTNVQNGLTDLSDLPLALMQNLYLSRSPNISYGSGSFDGVIHIRSLLKKSYIHLSGGSFGYRNGSGGYSLATSNTNFQIQNGYTSSKGNYPFSLADKTQTRSNNDYEQRFMSGLYQRHNHKNRIYKANVLFVDHDRGVAGSLLYPSPNARRKNNLIVTGLELIQIMEKGHLRLDVNQRSSNEDYNNVDMGTDSNHKVGSSGIRVHGLFQPTRKIKMNGFSTVKFQSIESSDIGKRERAIMAIGLQTFVQPIDFVSVKPGLRSDIVDETSVITSDLEATLDFENLGKFSAISGTGFYLPSFNDLYWPSDPYSKGNPSLKSETSNFHILNWNKTFGQGSNFVIEYRNKRSRNLIVWAPDENDVWKPTNLDSTERKNLIVSTNFPEIISGMTFSWTLTRTKTKNLNSGKTLQYVPEISATGMVRYTINDIQFELQSKYVGERTYQDYNENFELVDKALNPFQNVTAGVHF